MRTGNEISCCIITMRCDYVIRQFTESVKAEEPHRRKPRIK